MRSHELAELEPQTRRSLRVQAERDLARLSVPGAMVYFLVVLVVTLVTPYETDYPATVLSVGCLMLLVGGARLMAGMRLSSSPAETLFRWKGSFRLLVFSQFLLWGLFCALTVGLYGTEWTAMLVLFCSSALAGGGTSSLAPDYKLGARCLLAIMLPTSTPSVMVSTRVQYIPLESGWNGDCTHNRDWHDHDDFGRTNLLRRRANGHARTPNGHTSWAH